ncbi:inosine triphosphate pyrophosphatase-like protein [Phakopsora pachyrhizi]|uniref:Inosine triphosphate pyrophosphatase-like protein n=1 Tax=Phakopsora pachyrhizi TaxID=170000 RepID=A0AAV0BHL2_PHAPC|nr:inosine triphosphate pyrophosphatase-like protein [Phakopsora pachyrhizi]CAH7685781.1 inosine triphosphate pyrophosphatase-like protein [Phakopsora pachyrhizi]
MEPNDSARAAEPLELPIYVRLRQKSLILASSSPRRLRLLNGIGLYPRVFPSNFKEDLKHSDFDQIDDDPASKSMHYTVATATEKAIDVYRQAVESSPDQPPDLVIAADTVIQSTSADDEVPRIIEKPVSRQSQLLTLSELVDLSSSKDSRIEVVTGVSVVYPIVSSPGYRVKSFAESTKIWFGDLDRETLIAYVEGGEGIDRAGGFTIDGIGSQLIRRIDGDHNNVLGFPIYGFVEFLKKVMREDEDFLSD